MNYKKLNKNIKKVWLIYSLIYSLILLSSLIFIKTYIYKYFKNYYSYYNFFIFIIFIICILIILILPSFKYLRYRYLIKQNKLEFVKGILFIKTVIIPFKKIQYVLIKKDPINNIFGLASIKIFTINKHYLIQGLTKNEIEKIYKYIECSLNLKERVDTEFE